ncbi:hypothetical protein CIK91_06470 [Segatella bryantii]|uniref:DUF3244 domain-containing protein n=2 Tax=Segatella bryantii TaxID=77095 RepID=A0ABX4ENQ7_SEGBR|nr:hypothetical protein [Segatella bryantii]OYP55497.1 hypothetical protein CIK91_06470 [Segatella bryantii]
MNKYSMKVIVAMLVVIIAVGTLPISAGEPITPPMKRKAPKNTTPKSVINIDENSRIANISFYENIEDVTVLIYLDGVLIDSYEGQADPTTELSFDLFIAGSYTISVVSQGNELANEFVEFID